MSADWLLEFARRDALVLAVLVQIVGAALVFVAPVRLLAVLIAVLAAGAGALLAWSAALDLFHGGALDGVALAAAPLLSATTLASALAAVHLLPRGGRERALSLALLLCVSAGWMAALAARSFAELFAAIEAASLAAVALTAMGASSDRGAMNASLRLFVANGVGAILLAVGFVCVQQGAGVAALLDLADARAVGPYTARIGVALIVVGMALKIGAAPMHAWVGALFGRSDRFFSLTISAVYVVGALAVLIRIGAHLLQAPSLGATVSVVFAALGAVCAIIGSVQAASARNPMRMAAYCVMTQTGGALIGVALGSAAGLSSALLQLGALAAGALALFTGLAAAPREGGFAALDGLGRRAPFAGLALALAVLSAMGAPFTLGFLGRWRLMEAGLGADWWWTVLVGVAASLAAVFYGGSMLGRLYLRRVAVAAQAARDPMRVILAPIALASGFALLAAFAPSMLMRVANLSAAMTLGVAP